jgi:hypothetical protein
MRSYVKTRLGVPARLNEAWNLYLNHTRNVKENVCGLLDQARGAEAKISSLLGRPLTGLKMLEVGPASNSCSSSILGGIMRLLESILTSLCTS